MIDIPPLEAIEEAKATVLAGQLDTEAAVPARRARVIGQGALPWLARWRRVRVSF